mgnify:CR=1 FL=1
MADAWPALPLDGWKDTYETLHRWVQMVGKIRLVQTPWINHAWHSTLYVTALTSVYRIRMALPGIRPT